MTSSNVGLQRNYPWIPAFAGMTVWGDGMTVWNEEALR